MNHKELFEVRKNTPGPEGTFYPSPRKYSSKLHKKFAKLEEAFESTENKPLDKARIMKSANSTLNKIKKLGE